MTNPTLKIQKIRNVKTPNRAHATDAGIDFYVPDNLVEADFDKSVKLTQTPLNIIDKYDVDSDQFLIKRLTIKKHQSLLIPSGIKVAVPDNFTLILFNKSGVATKLHLDVGACVIDSGYRDEIHIHLTNTSENDIDIFAGDKIIQGVLIPILTINTELVDDINTLGKTSRGVGGFGSSGTS